MPTVAANVRTPLRRLAGGLAASMALLITLVLSAGPARANEACDLARHLMEIEALSTRITATGNTAAAQEIIDSMLKQIQSIPPGSARVISGELSAYDLAAFLESRIRMAQIFRTQGLAAAQRHINRSSYRAQSQGVRSLEGLLECGNGTRAAASAGSPATSSSGGTQRAANGARQLAAAPAKPGRSLAGIDARLIVLAAGILLIALVVFYLRRRMRRRDHTRFLCDLGTELRIGEAILPARIVDISVSGAKLKCDFEIAPRTHGTLSITDHGWVSFRVIWSNPHFAGIAFRSRLQFDLSNLTASNRRNHW